MKNTLIVCATLVLALAPLNARADNNPAPSTTHFSDGAVGTALAECATGDQCATLTLPGGDVVSVYAGQGGKCLPYKFRVVRMHRDHEVLAYDAQTEHIKGAEHFLPFSGGCHERFGNTIFTFDEGRAQLRIFLAKDGAVFGRWIGDEMNGGSVAGMQY